MQSLASCPDDHATLSGIVASMRNDFLEKEQMKASADMLANMEKDVCPEGLEALEGDGSAGDDEDVTDRLFEAGPWKIYPKAKSKATAMPYPNVKVDIPVALLRVFKSEAAKQMAATGGEKMGYFLAKVTGKHTYTNHRLWLPKQCSGPDWVRDEGDASLLASYCKQHDLQITAWIHSHPGFTSFLTSVDLHTTTTLGCR